MMRKIMCAAAGLLAAACLAGCHGIREEAEIALAPAPGVRAAVMTVDSAIKETVLVADPAGAVKEIFENLDEQPKLTEVTPDTLEDVMGIAPFEVMSFVAYTSDARNGLCDVAIIEPAPGKTDAVREALIQYGVIRAESFKNYDILGAYSIASGTTVFNQGEYVVMLMLPDNDAGIEIVDRFMPK